MKTFLITDTHFNHKKLIEYGRDPNFEDLIWQGLLKLSPDDVLIHLGDVCMGNDVEVHKQLSDYQFKKILVRGNHDRKTNTWYLDHGWDFVCDNLSDHYFGKYITFSHIPIKNLQNLNIHGHFHNSDHRKNEPEIAAYYNPKLHKLLAIELTGYQPVELEHFLHEVTKKV